MQKSGTLPGNILELSGKLLLLHLVETFWLLSLHISDLDLFFPLLEHVKASCVITSPKHKETKIM